MKTSAASLEHSLHGWMGYLLLGYTKTNDVAGHKYEEYVLYLYSVCVLLYQVCCIEQQSNQCKIRQALLEAWPRLGKANSAWQIDSTEQAYSGSA